MVRAFTYTRTMGRDLKAATEAAVLNANYVKAKLRGDYNLPFPQPSLHEVIFNDEEQKKNGVTTMDIAKLLLDCGFHAPTVYFPLVVDSALMIEPTDTEPKEELDAFIAAMKDIAADAKTNPERVTNTPQNTIVSRPDETLAARQLILKGE